MVAPAIIAGGIMAGGSIAGGLLGGAASLKAQKAAQKLAEKAASQYDSIRVPTPEELQVQLQNLIQQGEITPEEAQAYLVENSAYSGLDLSGGEGRQAELAALNELRGITEAGGLTAQDRAKIADIQEQMGTANRGAQEAIMQNAAQRGISGSGLEMASRLMAQQQAASDANRQGLQTAADAEKRALEAIIAQGGAGSRLSSADFEREAKVAEAKDLMARFNATNQQQVGLTNVAARNAAQAANLAEKQRIADFNKQQENQNRLRGSDLKQQAFENQMQLAGGKAAALSGAAQSANQRAQSQQQLYGSLIGTGGQMLGSLAPYMGTNEVKKDKYGNPIN